jgi:hypothetical protein
MLVLLLVQQLQVDLSGDILPHPIAASSAWTLYLKLPWRHSPAEWTLQRTWHREPGLTRDPGALEETRGQYKSRFPSCYPMYTFA